jgi:dolichol-phosphate mannosyltransferase
MNQASLRSVPHSANARLTLATYEDTFATDEDNLSEADQRVPLCLDLAVVIPTYNERGNIPELLARLEAALHGLTWEVLFVDDDSPDGTADLIRDCSRRDRRIRLIHRIGRRGLASACIEGILATTASAVAVMDADMQHDEAVLPRMLQALRQDSLDLVIGTRNACGGSMGQFGHARVMISRLGRRVSHCVCRCTVSDPMSGFFLVSRSFFSEVVHHLHGVGFKILVDMLSSAGRPVRYAEVGYTFRLRRHGESKLDVNTAIEYFLLIVEKLTDKFTGRTLPARFAAFALVGAAGVATHMVCVAALIFGLHWHFLAAQIAATYVAMTENFFLNNLVTWRDRSLRGTRLITGLASFWLACSFGAWANVVFARAVLHYGAAWYLACAAGIMLSSVWNYSMANLFTWQTSRQNAHHDPTKTPDLATDSPIYDLDISL